MAVTLAATRNTGFMDTSVGEKRRVLEIVAAVLLGMGGLLTAYAANAGAGASSEALLGYTDSSRLTTAAAQFAGRDTQRYLADQAVWIEYQLLSSRGETQLAQTLRSVGFSPELTELVQRWDARSPTERPLSPFDMEEGYTTTSGRIAIEYFAMSEKAFNDARVIDERSGSFGTATVILAVSLLLAGVATLFTTRRVQLAALVGSVLLMFPAFVLIGRGKAWW
jgi:hypothetical protein